MKLTERQGEIADRIREEAPGEILRLNPGVTGFRVVQRAPDAPRSNLYRVTLETHADGSESLHWELIGPVEPLESDENDEHAQP